jgi:hypothetical protein
VGLGYRRPRSASLGQGDWQHDRDQGAPGAIIVAHANGRGWHTADALALAIPKLKEEGYSFVTVSELLKAGKPVITASCYLNRPGDNTRIAHAAKRDGAPDALLIFEYPY